VRRRLRSRVDRWVRSTLRTGRLHGLWLAAGLVLLAMPQAARAHTISPDEIMARLRTPAAREAFGIEDVSRLEGLPRLLVVRVGPRWREVPAEKRRAVAEDWGRAWEHSVPQGIVSIVDAASGDSLVNFDGRGHALLAR
jgi:hypothetical protein